MVLRWTMAGSFMPGAQRPILEDVQLLSLDRSAARSIDAWRLRFSERRAELVALPTREAIKVLQTGPKDTNAILHVTC